ncbi:MAG: hydrolase [Candidatus Thiodiazotropha sp. (ex Semelilucina semeliformis)]|nr:hydrolase [Candidatus Thiodiazotropha sp. (ex Myrtea spinifera)]MCU7806566.1 hydrolase [Candidatus Thiodiazotropha sp. (ex Semelilucina semeliformis)]
MSKVIDSPFNAAPWLKSPHLQTIWPALMRVKKDIQVEWERVELRDGDFIDLAWHRANGPLVMLIHGLEGSLQSHYSVPMLEALKQAGFNTVFMHLRGCGREPNRLSRSYHSGATEDLVEVLEHLEQRGEKPSAAIGVSLGGNLLLKHLGESGRKSGLSAAVAVSVPFHLDQTAEHLQQGAARIYQKYLLDKLIASYRRKFASRPAPIDVNISSIDTIYTFDNLLTAPLNGFKDADDYYQRCSCIGFLNTIETPTLILQAKDDPFMPPDVIPNQAQLGPGVTLELSQHGGHVGFINGKYPWRLNYWLESRIPKFIRQQLKKESP